MQSRQIGIPNQMSSLVDEFMSGEPFGEKIALRIINSFDLANVNEEETYPFLIEQAKRTLERIDKNDHDGVIFLETKEDINIKLLVVIVRLLNLAHKGEYFILLNDGILYCPQEYSKHSLQEINQHLVQVVHSKERKRWLIDLKKKFFSYINIFISLEAIALKK